MPSATKKAPRIEKKASCIRSATTTVKLPRSQQINSSSFDSSLINPEMSGKYTALVKKIKELDALDRRDHGTRFKHFIFTDMRDGAKALAAFMVAGGFDFQMKHAPKFIMRKGERIETKKGDTVLLVGEPARHGNNGFVMLQSAPLWKNPLAVSTKKDILRVFNSRPDNVHGQLLRIIVLDSKYKEGIDLFDVKYVHFVEPPLAESDLKQALGRATRYCGQKGLRFMPNRGWPLEVYTYTTDIPSRAPFTSNESEQRLDAHDLVLKYSGIDLGFLQLTQQITRVAIASAVDARLNRHINTKITVQLGGGVRIKKCFRRQSQHFPFSKTRMMRVASQMGLAAPKKAKREFFCRLMDTNKDYRAALLKPATPKRVPVPIPEKRVDTLIEIAEKGFDDFQEGITEMFKKYTWKRPVLENGCGESAPAVVAKPRGTPVTFNPTQDFIRHYLTPSSPFKGLLAWHSVGTGKTCTAVATATSSFEQAGYQILWVTRNSLMSDVWKNIFGTVCSIPVLEKLKAGEVIPDELVDQKKMLSKAWLQPVSYRMFQNAMEKKNELGRRLYSRNSKDPLHKTFLIIDEVHKLYDGDLLPTEAADFDVIQSYIHASYKTSTEASVRVLLMSATPITESPDQLFGILNTLRTKDYLPSFTEFRERFTEDNAITEEGQRFFEERAKGLISYLNREFDPTTFAQPEFHTIRVPLGEMRMPTLERLADDCMRSISNCDEKDVEALVRDVKKNDMTAREYKRKISMIRKQHKTRKASCVKNAIRAAKGCYMNQKKTYTLRNKHSQIVALESCFGKPIARPFIPFAEFKDEIQRRITPSVGRESIESTGAVRTPVRGGLKTDL